MSLKVAARRRLIRVVRPRNPVHNYPVNSVRHIVSMLISVLGLSCACAAVEGVDTTLLPAAVTRQLVSTNTVGDSIHEIVHYTAGDRVLMSCDLWFSAVDHTALRRGFIVYDITLPVRKPGEPCNPQTPILVINQLLTPIRTVAAVTHHVPTGCVVQCTDADGVSPREWRLTQGDKILLSLTLTGDEEVRPRTRDEFDVNIQKRVKVLNGK